MAYINPVITSKEIQSNGVRIFVEALGDAGEDPIRAEHLITPGTTIADVRRWAFGLIAGASNRQTIADQITVGQAIPVLAPAAPPGPTARQVWANKADRLVQAKAIGLTDATALSDIAALESDVNATYQAGFIA